jgi:hypothetical protein
VPKNRFQSHSAFYRFEIYPVDHECTSSPLAAPTTDVSPSIPASD